MTPLVYLHIFGGSLALGAGSAAAALRKGQRGHLLAGNLFCASMLVLATSGFILAALRPERLSAVSALITIYLIATGWMAARRKPAGIGPVEIGALALGIGCVIADTWFGIAALRSQSGSLDGYPAAAYFVFAGVVALATILDCSVIQRGGVTGKARLARHLWRMCLAFFIATGSFFLGQQQLMPEAIQGSPVLFASALAPLAIMTYWLVRVRSKRSPVTGLAARDLSKLPA